MSKVGFKACADAFEQLMKYMKLDQKGYCMAEYIWVDGTNGVRSKTKVRVCPVIKSLFYSLPSPSLETESLGLGRAPLSATHQADQQQLSTFPTSTTTVEM